MATNRRNGLRAPYNAQSPLGYEATLWQAADKLRNNLDAAELKGVSNLREASLLAGTRDILLSRRFLAKIGVTEAAKLVESQV